MAASTASTSCPSASSASTPTSDVMPDSQAEATPPRSILPRAGVSSQRRRSFDVRPTRSSSFFAAASVASAALEAEIDDGRRRLLSGRIVMNAAASGAAWNGSTNGCRDMAVRPFVEAFGGELRRLEEALRTRRAALEGALETLLTDAVGLSRRREEGAPRDREAGSLRARAKALQAETLKLMGEAAKNQKELHRIARWADSLLGTSCSDDAGREFAHEPWTEKNSAGHIVMLLSDIFSLIRQVEKDAKEKSGTWVAPSSFERVTTKYWVREEDLPEVLLRSASELPVLVYGKTGLLTKNPGNPSEGHREDFWKSLASPISSVYFDSDGLDMYAERIKRSEGAQLFRVRWYGSRKPAADATLFLELKTHHESWIDNPSVKERVALRQSRMSELIDVSDGPWDRDRAGVLVTEAVSPDAAPEDVETATDLLLEIRNLFCKLKLKPCVRTSYVRAAFQSPDNNDLRLTIDRDITVIDERRAFENNRKNGGSSWCIDDNDVVPIGAFIKVPYSVFEVKVAGSQNPFFVEQLKNSDAIVEASKFSKFLTGASLHNANEVDMLPWWSEDELFAPMFQKKKLMRSCSIPDNTPLRQVRFSTNNNAKDSLEKDKALVAAEEGLDSRTRTQIVSGGKSLSDHNNRSLVRSSTSLARTGLYNRFFTNSQSSGHSNKTKVAPRSPARVEPKSFFANERTFIQWITVGSLFMFVAGIVYAEALSVGPEGKPLMIFGHGLIGCAFFVVLYGSIIYYRRLYLMINAKPYGYSDTFGPAVLAIFMSILLATFVYVYHLQFLQLPQSNPNARLVELPGACVKRNLDLGPSSGVSFLQFEPSDIVIDKERDLMIVASLDEIIALPAGLPSDSVNTPIQILYQFPEGTEDLEALEIINGTIYAISENKKSTEGLDQSDLIALDWTDGLLKESNRWRLSSPNAEGMAYTSDPNWFQSPYLLVAADLRALDMRLQLTGFRVPFPKDGEIPERRLNNKFFTQNLKDTKVAAMQFFGDHLYVLYNNAREIRAFDYLGNQVNEWKLPVAVENYERMWEGMRLEQNENELYLHLALDSPPQLWSIKLEVDTAANSPGGQWEFPKCANS